MENVKVNSSLASTYLAIENAALLKVMIDLQSRILANLEKRSFTDIKKETDLRLGEFLKESLINVGEENMKRIVS